KLDEEPDFGTTSTVESGGPGEMSAETENPFENLADTAQTAPAPAMPDAAIAGIEPQLNVPAPADTPSAPALEAPVESDPFQTPLEVADIGDAPVAAPSDDIPSLMAPPQDDAAQQVDEKTASVEAKPISAQPQSDTDAKMALIRERGGMKGLKGFCPVTLRDERELLDAQNEYFASFRGQKFHFATQAAKEKFDADPQRYVPAAYGADVVVLIRDKDVSEGSLDYAAWYKGKLYLFAKAETHDTFVVEPAKYAAPAGLE
ncbi:MAG: hypothetical protein B7Z55_06800, partial [Planctomycetales bacterium 12-60-4]